MNTHLYDIRTRFNDNDDHDDYFCAICETRLLVSLSFTFNFIRFAHFTTNARRPCHVAVEKWILIKVLFHFKFRYWFVIMLTYKYFGNINQREPTFLFNSIVSMYIIKPVQVPTEFKLHTKLSALYGTLVMWTHILLSNFNWGHTWFLHGLF